MNAKMLLLSVGLLSGFLLSACHGDADVQPQAPILNELAIAEPLALSLSDCLTLDAEYIAALEDARRCNPLTPAKQCTLLRAGSLVCGCAEYVNPRNTDALAMMRVATNAWRAGACVYHVTTARLSPVLLPKLANAVRYPQRLAWNRAQAPAGTSSNGG